MSPTFAVVLKFPRWDDADADGERDRLLCFLRESDAYSRIEAHNRASLRIATLDVVSPDSHTVQCPVLRDAGENLNTIDTQELALQKGIVVKTRAIEPTARWRRAREGVMSQLDRIHSAGILHTNLNLNNICFIPHSTHLNPTGEVCLKGAGGMTIIDFAKCRFKHEVANCEEEWHHACREEAQLLGSLLETFMCRLLEGG